MEAAMQDEAVDESTALLQSQEAGAKLSVHGANSSSASSAGPERCSSATNLPSHNGDHASEDASSSSLAIWIVIPISLIGVFVAHADTSLVVASSQHIASEFDQLFNAQWLFTSYILAQCATQPLYGKLSEIFGRKTNLVVAYALFASGCLICGAGNAYWQVLTGRAVSGIGGAGMTALVSVIITDMVPVRDVASWRSYVNIAATMGRALGGPVGGWLCDVAGWRWCFYGQVPLSVAGLILILWKMPSNISKAGKSGAQTLSQKWKRLDVVGSFFLASAISCFLLLLDFVAKEHPLRNVLMFATSFLVLITAFCLVEEYWAQEPVLPLRLLVTRPALTSYLLAGFQMAAQTGLFYSVPLYYQIVSESSVGQAGLRLVPAVVGNVIAGLTAGYLIKKTGHYKSFTIFSSVIACFGYVVIVVRWRGTTSWWDTWLILCGGFGSGAIQSTTFIHLAASLEAEDMAIAGTTVYLANSVFQVVGVQTSTTIQRSQLQRILNVTLGDTKHKSEVIRLATSSIRAIRQLPAQTKLIVTQSYIESLTWTFGASVVWAVLGVLVGISLKERELPQ